MGAVLKFPIQRSAQAPLPQTPPLEPLDPEKTQRLLGVANDVVQGSRILVNFLDTHRSVARAAGIEALTVELSGIIDGRRIEPITDALDESARMGKPAEISAEGFYYLKRAEKLLAEAHEDLARFTGSQVPGGSIMSVSHPGLGQAVMPAGSSPGDNTVVIVALLAVVSVAIVALALK
jgi:hypothetical protein